MDEDFEITFMEAIKPALVITVGALALMFAWNYAYEKIQDKRFQKKMEQSLSRIRFRRALGLKD